MELNPWRDLTVCDIIGAWGKYQWSITLFGIFYSAIFGIATISGPVLAPNLAFVCADSLQVNATGAYPVPLPFDNKCPTGGGLESKAGNSTTSSGCSKFLYDESQFGKVLTNSFDLVCDREWLKSSVTSSPLIGMLLSSVSLGLFSDKFGRVACIRLGGLLAILANLGAIFVENIYLFNFFIMITSYALVGICNAICTLVMEATTPKYRFAPVFEYGIGWSIGGLIVPLISDLTRDYRLYLACQLVGQLILMIWFRFGIFESIRWLLSEGKINEAQIELQRACQMNGVEDGAELAQKIALVQSQQLRKASSIIEQRLAPSRLAQATKRQVEETAQELGELASAVRRSFAISAERPSEKEARGKAEPEVSEPARLEGPLSHTLARKSFSLMQLDPSKGVPGVGGVGGDQGNSSVTAQALAHLALKYSRKVESQEEGSCFVTRLFHPKLYKVTILCLLWAIMSESSYFGLVQANKFVGPSVRLNYFAGALSDMAADFTFMVLLWGLSRRAAVILPGLIGSLTVLGIALTYHLLPEQQQVPQQHPAQNIEAAVAAAEALASSPLSPSSSLFLESSKELEQLVANVTQNELGNATSSSLVVSELKTNTELRDNINFWLMNVGKLAISTTIQVYSTISMESYPNNLRQTASGTIVFFGRIGSIGIPFLVDDPSPSKNLFKVTMLTLSSIGLLACLMTALFLRDTKDQDLCDRLSDISERKKSKS